MLKKEGISILLSCVIVLSLLLVPVFAFASETATPANDATPLVVTATPSTDTVMPSAVSTASTPDRRDIVCNGVRVRSQPNTSTSTILGLLYEDNNDYIDITEWAVWSNGYYHWVYGRTSTGIYGWVSADYLKGC